MKKLIVAILSLVYLSATVGITLQRHYCMNRFVGWSLMNKGGDLCGRCGMDKSDGCCKDEELKLKIGDEQQASFIAVQFHQPELQASPYDLFYQELANIPADNAYVVDHGPPQAAAIPVYLLNQVFRI